MPNIRCGDWEACPLSPPQLQYAATDAFASLYLYQVKIGYHLGSIQEEATSLSEISTLCICGLSLCSSFSSYFSSLSVENRVGLKTYLPNRVTC